MRVVLWGAGLQARAALVDLARQEDLTEISVADRDEAAARALAERVGDARVRVHAVDAADVEAVRALGVIDLPTIQKKANLHYSLSLDLFGLEGYRHAPLLAVLAFKASEVPFRPGFAPTCAVASEERLEHHSVGHGLSSDGEMSGR